MSDQLLSTQRSMTHVSSPPPVVLDHAFDAGARKMMAARLKRAIDILGSAGGLIALAPFLLLLSAAIRLESPGASVFRQRRSGYLGATFSIYKFRTMRVVEDGANIVQATRDDERVTPLGRIMRRTSLDELPQLLNVLKGEMSLIGPRPHALAHDEYYASVIPYYDARFKVRPGITGLAQVSGLRGPTEEIATMAARVDKDLEYIRDWSLVLDLRILFKTLVIFTFHPAGY